jgi:hypothetical protein
VVVGETGWEAKLEANKQAFAGQWVERPDFQSIYGAMSNAEFVERLFANAEVAPEPSERDALISSLDARTETRAAVLQRVAENAEFRRKEFNPAFVLMQYFGYLRRDPDSGPDTDMSGYNFWLHKLDNFGGNFINAEMVKAFINSQEYKERFGQP